MFTDVENGVIIVYQIDRLLLVAMLESSRASATANSTSFLPGMASYLHCHVSVDLVVDHPQLLYRDVHIMKLDESLVMMLVLVIHSKKELQNAVCWTSFDLINSLIVDCIYQVLILKTFIGVALVDVSME